MKVITTILSISFLVGLFANDKTDAVNYINEYRNKVGLNSLGVNNLLNSSAQNHSDYMSINNLTGGHYQNESQFPTGFTGVEPTDRAEYVGYKASISENISAGSIPSHDVYSSVSGLYSAIYHQFGFLSFDIDEIGVGISINGAKNYYTYNMGDSNLNSVCSGLSASYGYYLVCADDNFYIESDIYNTLKDTIKKQNPPIVVWPPVGGNFTEPVFYEESPDPLPDYGLSGYPVSIQFNDYFFEDVAVNNFVLRDYESNQELDLIYMDESTDPNNKFSQFQFAVFPKKRLNWGHVYRAEVTYDINHTKQWCFHTKTLDYPLYSIDTNETTIDLKSGVTYAVYFEPTSQTDKFTGYGTNGYITNLETDFIDHNTLKITVIGDIGLSTDLSTSSGKEITIIISNTDSAVILDDPFYDLQSCSQEITSIVKDENEIVEDQNFTITFQDGWNLVSLPVDLNISYNELNSVFESADTLWTYNNGWKAYGKGTLQNLLDDASISRIDSLRKGEGFWINSSATDTLEFSGSSYDSVTPTTSGWHLLGSGKDFNVTDIETSNSNLHTVWIYDNGWQAYGTENMAQTISDAQIPSLSIINRGQGYWINNQ